MVVACNTARNHLDTRYKTRGNMTTSRIKKGFHFVLGLRNRREIHSCISSDIKEIRIFETATDNPTCPFCSNILEDITSSFQESHENTSRYLVSGRPVVRCPSPWKWECKSCAAYVLFNEDMDYRINAEPRVPSARSR